MHELTTNVILAVRGAKGPDDILWHPSPHLEKKPSLKLGQNAYGQLKSLKYTAYSASVMHLARKETDMEA